MGFEAVCQMAKKRILCFPPSISSAWPSPKNLSPVPLSALFLAPLVRLISFFRSPSSSPSYNVLSPLLLEGNIYIFFMAQSLWKIPSPPPIFLIIRSKNEPSSASALLKTDVHRGRHFLPEAGRQPSPPCHAVPTDKTDTAQAGG